MEGYLSSYDGEYLLLVSDDVFLLTRSGEPWRFNGYLVMWAFFRGLSVITSSLLSGATRPGWLNRRYHATT